MSLSPGTRLGHYQVSALIGEGGMGQVYQATDTQLNRQVALKILPDAFASDPDRLARFEREAQVLASLNHPGIAAIHGIEKSDDTQALVLELVEGPTLEDRIAEGPIPIDEALPIAKQIAEALEAAHEAGVIHRDLKPANIKVREDGTVKVLDFGLAKALDTAPEGDPNQSPTLTAAATQMGVIMGTAAYMSPEQARGKPVDKRADIWALGVVLVEMLTGRPVFEGEDVSLTLSHVLQGDPDYALLPSGFPAGLEAFVRRCLAKNPTDRLHDVADLRLALQGAFEMPSDALSGARGSTAVWQRPWAIALVALTAATMASVSAWRLAGQQPPSADVLRLSIPASGTRTPKVPPLSLVRNIAISPDGTQIVYPVDQLDGTGTQLYLRALDRDESEGLRLPETEDGTGPFFSPDGEWIGFFDGPATQLQKVPTFGGVAVPLLAVTDARALHGGHWGEDTIIVGSVTGLRRIPATGGEPEFLTSVDVDRGETGHTAPFIVPGSNAVLFSVVRDRDAPTQELAVLTGAGTVTRLGLPGSSPHLVSSGHLVYLAEDGSLWGVGFDLDALTVVGEPVRLLDGVQMTAGGRGGRDADFDVSATGRLVYVASEATQSLVWVNRGGEPITTVIENENEVLRGPRLSPDGSQIAFQRLGGIWIRDLDRGSETKLTEESVASFPVWTRDGLSVAFSSDRSGDWDVYSRPVDLSRPAELLVDHPEMEVSGSWSSDGTLVYHRVHSETKRDLWLRSASGDSSPFLVTPDNEFSPRLSPNNQWVAYVSDRSGDNRVYVQPFPDGGRVVPISTGSGTEAVWSRDGRELFYLAGNALMVVPVDPGPEFVAGSPTLLFENAGPDTGVAGLFTSYDVSLDGQRFLVVRQTATIPQINIVLNWHTELVERVPVN